MITTIITDCDGTLTDGKYYYTKSGKFITTFHANDSYAAHMMKEQGVGLILISSGSFKKINERRAKDIDADFVWAPVGMKEEIFNTVPGLDPDKTAYIGDCLDDIPMLKICKLSFCPSDAIEEVQKCTDIVLKRAGGQGCLLEAWVAVMKYNEKEGG
jgi:YrbI family 3-deoxy-D-manno-octulosonate 8-phosphate phosphatase